jgi:hypothetical protein
LPDNKGIVILAPKASDVVKAGDSYVILWKEEPAGSDRPIPPEKAIQECLRKALAHSGVETIPITGWDGKPESMKGMKVDLILMIVIKKFWMEGRVGQGVYPECARRKE